MTSAPDMTASIVPRSDQINSEDLLTGPVTVTITDVKRGSTEQPVDIVTAEFGPGRAYKPSKTMRRIIIAAWGTNSADYIGRRITIYRDPEVMFGPDKVGGIKISHLSHIDKRLEIALTVKRGRRAAFAVDPLRDAPPTKPAPISEATVAEFERRIVEADSVPGLDTIAGDLKAYELGAHREGLLSAWSERRTAITAEEKDRLK